MYLLLIVEDFCDSVRSLQIGQTGVFYNAEITYKIEWWQVGYTFFCCSQMLRHPTIYLNFVYCYVDFLLEIEIPKRRKNELYNQPFRLKMCHFVQIRIWLILHPFSLIFDDFKKKVQLNIVVT